MCNSAIATGKLQRALRAVDLKTVTGAANDWRRAYTALELDVAAFADGVVNVEVPAGDFPDTLTRH
ncbi:hypothetical protein AVHY2522_19740 [Acidovorax sp. SUPP2522]|uniref:hypothetical protein n=1 Tax=unclassified Acidovorax TaxID=2684926 RepID=UPI002349C398|nr:MULTISPECIES: hypothetical protein [unclassified Acidovorax]WCM96545.1 hypothetical protein M5C96_19255 [Acidovorax sp. GBBC 1281]GKT18679.1 hypothetical protein AVHY2522_19740 [Acidovorax sp. SUPP2522]